jgi:alpha-glucosidase (family GH31 glycosyl hydrolase)
MKVGDQGSKNWEEYNNSGYLLIDRATGVADSFWEYNTPTGNAVVDATNAEALKTTFQKWYDGYGKYGIRAMWMDESEPDHAKDITGGQWNLAKGVDAEVLPAWVYDWTKGFQVCRL